MAIIKFYGNLRRYGDQFNLDVEDTAEALRALYNQIPNFRKDLQQGYFTVKIDSEFIDPEYVEMGLFKKIDDKTVVKITPVLKGAGGAFQAIAGAVMIVVGAILVYTGVGAGLGYGLIGAGIGMFASGVSTMLAKTPTMPEPESGLTEKKQSTSFSSLQNMVAQGKPVPIAYGRIMVGSLIISKGVETYRVDKIDPKVSDPTLKTQGRRGLAFSLV